jgi:glycosyltransferase involved in cell wall biosynthesis
MFATVGRFILHSVPELELLTSLYAVDSNKARVVGGGVETEFPSNAAAFRRKYHITSPFVLYAGRRDTGKNVEMLLDFYRRFRARRKTACELVLIGGASEPSNVRANEGVHDLGFVPLQDKYGAYGAAAVLCQPSTHESFSIVMMEAWAAGAPCLVNARCAVTRDHAEKSNGGLYFNGYGEFEACLDLLLARETLRRQLGANGQQYVRANFGWSTVIARYREVFDGYWAELQAQRAEVVHAR